MKKTIAIVLALALLLSLSTTAFAKKDDKTITVAASPTPHAEILAVAAEVLEKEGWKLEIVEYNDYVVPNNVVEDGEIDANYFQHQPYLDTFNEENGTHLVSVAMVHYEPFGIYAGTKDSVADLAKGDKIAPTTAPTAPVPCCCWRPRASSSWPRTWAWKPPFWTSPRRAWTWTSLRWKPLRSPVSVTPWLWPSSTATTPCWPV